jgi:tetratricopeptide (TPR) repeat protein
MSRRCLSALAAAALFGACSAEPPVPPQIALGEPESSELVFQAVDAGTGSALQDAQMMVRYLVRAPITLDASAMERVASTEPYRIAHEVAESDLVVEVRLEAASYFTIDTVLSVPRGQSGGPFTIRMARKLAQSARTSAAPTRPTGGSAPVSQPAASPPSARPAAATATIDRSALDAGNQAYARGDWLEATTAYERMQAPSDPSSAYAGEYAEALVQRGIAHINRAEYGGALEALETAMNLDDPGFEAHLRLGQTQCAVGRTDEGRGNFAALARVINRMPPAERPFATAMTEYYKGRCSEGDFDRAEATLERMSAGAGAIREYEKFIELAGNVSPSSAELQAAVDDATQRIAGVRARIRG